MTDCELPKFDLPTAFVVTDEIPVALLQAYGRFPCKIKACLFILCTRGEVQATVNLSKQTIRAGDFITLLPDSFIQIDTISDDIHLYVTGFSNEFMNRSNYLMQVVEYFYFILQHPSLPLPPRIVRLFEQAYRLMLHVNTFGRLENDREALTPLLSLCLRTCVRLYRHHLPRWNKEANRDKEICREFIIRLMEHYAREHSVAFYAEACGVTVPHFCSAVKRASGYTALTLINHVLVMNAKEQLYTSRRPVKEIAFALGFNNPSHFNRFFREHTGVTPQQYREMKD